MCGGQTARQLRLIRDRRPDGLTCPPADAIYLGETARADGIDPAELSLTVGIHGAEPWTDAMREQIESLLGIRALDIYGLSEVIGPGVSCETLYSEGWLHVQDDLFMVEALDTATGKPVPDGELGELTFTTLTKQALPLLRDAYLRNMMQFAATAVRPWKQPDVNDIARRLQRVTDRVASGEFEAGRWRFEVVLEGGAAAISRAQARTAAKSRKSPVRWVARIAGSSPGVSTSSRPPNVRWPWCVNRAVTSATCAVIGMSS